VARKLKKAVPTIPFRYVHESIYHFSTLTRTTVLEAPNLRDDFYCSMLAYSSTLHALAVGLADKVYLWSEAHGVQGPFRDLTANPSRAGHVTSLAFSSAQGGNAILAVARANGQVVLWSPLDVNFTRNMKLPNVGPATHVSFSPKLIRRSSQRDARVLTDQELLLVGYDTGVVSVWFIEWPNAQERRRHQWHGSFMLRTKIFVHTQQICGIAWSSTGEFFATGANDNLCTLFLTKQVLARPARSESQAVLSPNALHTVYEAEAKHQWRLSAAVKAIAFCPWQRGLIAIGGGSNDRCIHFYHTISGTCLAILDCGAQITSLVWSSTRREIAATFGFAQPDHPYRVAVYSWPDCQQVVAIPWQDEMRALYAIAYPGGPNTRRSTSEVNNRGSRIAEEGCLVVASSDGSIKFHEVWCDARKSTSSHAGLLGGSSILEGLHGFEKEGRETIR